MSHPPPDWQPQFLVFLGVSSVAILIYAAMATMVRDYPGLRP